MTKTSSTPSIEAKIARAKTLLESDFALPWTAPELARAVGISTIQLHDGFKRRFGQSPLQYLTDVRIRTAGELLIAGNGVTETAHACGFRTPAAFSALFFRRTGIHASHYRFKMVGWKYGPAALQRRAPIAKTATAADASAGRR